MPGKLRTAVIGFGIGEKHALAYSLHPACELVMLCDFDPVKAEEARQKFPGVRVVPDADEVIGNTDVDLISIASWDNYHYEQIMGGIASGKHLFVEKPICINEEQAREVQEAFKRHPELKMSSNLVLRTTPRFKWLKEKIASGDYGRLYYIEGDYNYGRLHKIISGWRGRVPGYSGVHGGGVHIIDLLLWLTNDRIVEVFAYGNSISSEGSGFQNYDLVSSVLKFQSGATGKFSVNLGAVMPHFHGLNIYGTNASFVNRIEDGQVFKVQDQNRPEFSTVPYPGTRRNEIINSFIDSIVFNAEPMVSPDEVFASMSVCFAIEKSVHTGNPVKVEYL